MLGDRDYYSGVTRRKVKNTQSGLNIWNSVEPRGCWFGSQTIQNTLKNQHDSKFTVRIRQLPSVANLTGINLITGEPVKLTIRKNGDIKTNAFAFYAVCGCRIEKLHLLH